VNLEPATTEGGRTVYVDQSDVERGSKGAFLVVYADDEGETRWGYRCQNCETFDNAMDTMGRIECNACGNIRKPEEWDAAHE
jgi:hypothetical protein